MSPGGAPLRRPSEDFAPARALLDYVRSAPSGVGDTVVDEDQVRAELARLLAALDGMVARLPGGEADPESEAEAPSPDIGGVLNLVVTAFPFLPQLVAQQLALVLVDLTETLWYLEHVNEREASWYCRFGYSCNWGDRLSLVREALAKAEA